LHPFNLVVIFKMSDSLQLMVLICLTVAYSVISEGKRLTRAYKNNSQPCLMLKKSNNSNNKGPFFRKGIIKNLNRMALFKGTVVNPWNFKGKFGMHY